MEDDREELMEFGRIERVGQGTEKVLGIVARAPPVSLRNHEKQVLLRRRSLHKSRWLTPDGVEGCQYTNLYTVPDSYS